MKTPICKNCKKETKRKFLGKIRGTDLCKKCREEIRLNHREKTIDKADIREELKELTKKQSREYREARKIKDIRKAKANQVTPPKLKGSIKPEHRSNNNCYLTLQEKQGLFRILTKRGISREEADERIKNLEKSQRELAKHLRKENKPMKEIKTRQQEMLGELWNY